MKILQIDSSIKGDASVTRRLSSAIVERLRAENANASICVRSVAKQLLLDESAFQAFSTQPEARTPEQKARITVDDEAIAELVAADVIVIGVPMYKFGIPVQLKAWFDAVCRAQVTFRYTPDGKIEGLVTGKKAYVVLARGGFYRDSAMEIQEPYLRTVLGYLGISDVTFVYAEGMLMGPDSVAKGVAMANAQIAELALAEVV